MTDSSRARFVRREHERQIQLRRDKVAVAGPEAAVERVVCHRCGAANPRKRRFCHQCGAVLWKQCPKCSAKCAAHEAFCGDCGEDLAAVEQTLVRKHEQQLAAIQAMIKRFELNEALLSLRTLRDQQTHPCLAEVRAETEQLAEQVSAERDRMLQLAAGVVDRARQLDDAKDYDAAVVQLEKIPAPLRNETTRQLLAEVQRKSQQVRTLKQQIRETGGSNTQDRLIMVGQLLNLCPNERQVQNWAVQLRDHACKIAVRKRNQHEYGDALALLDAIPDNVSNTTVEELQRQLSELAFLKSEMELAPTVSDYSVRAVRRLVQLDSGFDQGKRYLAEMVKRRKASPHDRHGHGVTWKVCPRLTHVGVAVEHEGIQQRTPLSDAEARRAFTEYPGRFSVACGLALQALRKASIDTNLLPQDSPTLLDRLRTPLVPRPVRRGWGLDLGGLGLSVVCMVLNDAGDPVVERCIYVPHRLPLTHPQDKNQRFAMALQSLRRFAAGQTIGPDDRVAVQVSALRVLARFLRVPNAQEKKLKELVRYEVKHQLPFSLDELCLDSYVFPSLDLPVGIGQREGFVLAVKTDEAKQQRELFRQAGIPAHVMQCDVVALHNWIHNEQFARVGGGPGSYEHGGIAALEVGQERSIVLFSFTNAMWFRAVTLAGHEMTRAFVERFQMTNEMAHQMLHEPTAARRFSELHELRCRMFSQLVQHYQRGRDEAQQQIVGFALDKMFVTGEVGRLPGLLRYLRFGK